MPPKKTETKSEGAAAPKAKSSPHSSYQVCELKVDSFFYCVSTANTLQAMITDAIVAVIHPPHFFFLECSAHFWWLFGHSMGDA